MAARAGRWLLLLACLQLMSCELIADFDRGKLTPATGPDLTPRDAGAEDAG